jgi:glycosyltransferase involved in cell wall biosynthesis
MRGVGDAATSWVLFTPRIEEFEAIWQDIDASGVPVEWPGLVADVREAYARCDVVYIPSRNESFCRVAAEAMLNGVPVVAADIEAVREVVGADSGILVPGEDVDAAVAALRSVLLDDDTRARMGAAGRSRAERFAPAAVVASLRRLYGVPAA